MYQHRSLKLDLERQQTILNGDGSISVFVPVLYKKVGGRNFIVSPTEPVQKYEEVNEQEPLLNAITRAFRWHKRIEQGKYSSMREIAEKESLSESYVCRIYRLTLLAPDIVDAILSGKQPKTLNLTECLKPFPLEWEAQRIKFGFKMASI